MNKTIFTYVSPLSNHELASSLCAKLPILMHPINTVEELFPLLSDPKFHTDFVIVNIDVLSKREDMLDMFDIINTLSILIKSTVYRKDPNTRPQKRNTKIMVIVRENTDVKLIKEAMKFPDIITIGWVISTEEDVQTVTEHLQHVIAGDYSHHPKVTALLKNKKKVIEKKETITLTVRQTQILKLIKERGASNKMIARQLGISESTVKLHMGAMLKKYGVKNRTQLVVFSNGHASLLC